MAVNDTVRGAIEGPFSVGPVGIEPTTFGFLGRIGTSVGGLVAPVIGRIWEVDSPFDRYHS